MTDHFYLLVHIDDEGYKAKPAGSEVGRLKSVFRQEKTIKSVRIEELIQKLITGHTVEPGLCPYPDQSAIPFKGGTCEEYYKGQQLFMVDIDNDRTKLKGEKALNPPDYETPDSYREKLLANNIRPAFFYYSFSSGNPIRFRCGIVTDEMTGSVEEGRAILAALIALSDYSDTSCVDVSKIFYGTNKGVVQGFTDLNAINSLDTLRTFAQEMKEEVAERFSTNAADNPVVLKGQNSEDFREAERKRRNGESFVIPKGNRDNYISAYAFDRWKRYGLEGEAKVREDVIQMAFHCDPPLTMAYVNGKIERAKNDAIRKIFSRDDWTPPKEPEKPISPQEDFEGTDTEMSPEEEKGLLNSIYSPSNLSTPNIPPETENGVIQAGTGNIKDPLAELKRQASSYVDQYIDSFKEKISTPDTEGHTPTGLPDLDRVLNGGLYPGLFTIGGTTGCGKTTLALQIADYIAEHGRDVLYFSLEMDREELIARSISRMSYERSILAYSTSDHSDLQSMLDSGLSLTESDPKMRMDADSILTPEKKRNWTSTLWDKINKVISNYRNTIGHHLQFICSLGGLDSGQIAELVNHHLDSFMDDDGNIPPEHYPVVIVDYLQILAAKIGEERQTDKQRIDGAVMDLKRIARDHRIPVIAVSSVNRDSYNNPIDLSSFKESGAIEYTADCVIGLQLDGMDVQQFDLHRAYRIVKLRELAEQRKRDGDSLWLQAKVLKNRRGITDHFPLDYNARYNLFSIGDYHERDEIKQIAKEANETKPNKDKQKEETKKTDYSQKFYNELARF